MVFNRFSMSLNKRLLLSLVIPAFLLVAIGASGFISVRILANAADRILSDNYRSIQAARRMERALISLDSCLLLSSVCDEGAIRATRLFEKSLVECEGNITEAEEPAILSDIRAQWNELKSWINDRRQPGGNAKLTEARSPMELHDLIGRLIEVNERAMFNFERASRRTAGLMTGVVAASSLAALAALFLFAFIAAKHISRPIIEVADNLHKALSHPGTEEDSSGRKQVDEIARLREEMEELLVRLARYESEQSRRFRELQDRFMLVSNQVREGLLLLGEGYQVLYINQQGRKILGFGNEEVIGKSLGDLSLSERVATLLEPVFSGDAVKEMDLSEFSVEDEEARRIYRPRFLPGRIEDMPEASLLIFWDVTEQRRFEEAKRGFIAMLSHQLKTPITSLSMSVNLLRERLEDIPEETAELLDHAKTGCANLSMLVSELIDAARESAPEMTLRPVRIDLVPLLRSAIKPLKPQAEDKGLTILDGMGARSAWATVDPIKFSWVITNAVGNALRYTARGGSIKILLLDTPSGIEIQVMDTGIGIDPERLRGIFTPTDPSEVRDPGSHGLGLSIAKEIVDAHRGAISIDSKPGKGTTVRVTIPKPDEEKNEPDTYS